MTNAYACARAALLALAVLLMGTVFLPSPASAHQGNITAVAQCQADGTYLVTYQLSWSAVPDNAFGTRILTREDTDGAFDSGWENNPDAYSWTDRGAITTTQGSISWTDTLPGTTLGAGQWEYGYLDWANGTTTNRFHDTRVEDLKGDCADTTQPEGVTVGATFGDNVCVDNVYTEPTLDAPEYAGTVREVTGQVAPGQTVTVTYTALDGYVIEGPSTFTHQYPATPASQTNCDELNPPQPEVTDRSRTRTDCTGVETREWQIVREYTWNGETWVLGQPEILNDTGWVKVRSLTKQERKQLGCLEVKGEEEVDSNPQGNPTEVAPVTQVSPPTSTEALPQQTVPTAVDAGLSADVAPVGPRWLAPLLGGVIMLGLAAFNRLRTVGQRP